jgi:pilus assembly protein Flp/PilA
VAIEKLVTVKGLKMKNLLNTLTRFRDCDKGATLVEYGIALGLAITLGAGAMLTLGKDVGNTMTDAGAAMPRAAAAASE